MISSASWILGALLHEERTRRAALTLAKPHAEGPPAVYWLVPPYEKISIGGNRTELDELLLFIVYYGVKRRVRLLNAVRSKVGARLFQKLADVRCA